MNLKTFVRSGDLDAVEADVLRIAASHAAHGDPTDALWHTREEITRDFRDARLAAFAAGAAFAWASTPPDVDPASYRSSYRPR